MEYKERLACPEKTNKYYTNGKYNPFVYNYDMFKIGGNCTTYSYGRMAELIDRQPTELPTSNAENWYQDTKFKKGSIPKLGAIICWSKGKIHWGKDGAGHVAVVEKINDDGSITISESGYKSFLFRTRTIKQPYKMSGYKLEGFIYCPNNYEIPLKGYKGTYPTLPSRGYFYYDIKNKKVVDKGTQVKNLQKLLNWLINSNLIIDGKFGPACRSAVLTFQKKYSDLADDGKFGPACLKKAKSIKK